MVEDRTGLPRTDREIEEAIDAVKECMIKFPLALPLFTVHAGIIKNGLEELLERRAKDVVT